MPESIAVIQEMIIQLLHLAKMIELAPLEDIYFGFYLALN